MNIKHMLPTRQADFFATLRALLDGVRRLYPADFTFEIDGRTVAHPDVVARLQSDCDFCDGIVARVQALAKAHEDAEAALVDTEVVPPDLVTVIRGDLGIANPTGAHVANEVREPRSRSASALASAAPANDDAPATRANASGSRRSPR